MTLFKKALGIRKRGENVRIRCIISNSEHFNVGETYTGKVTLLSSKSVEIAVKKETGKNKANFNIQIGGFKKCRYGLFKFVMLSGN